MFQLLRGGFDCRYDVGIARAAAQVSAHALSDLLRRQICEPEGLRTSAVAALGQPARAS